MTTLRTLTALTALGAATLASSLARAQSCNDSTECPKNYICNVAGTVYSNCPSAAGGASSVASSGPTDSGVSITDPTAAGGAVSASDVGRPVGAGNATGNAGATAADGSTGDAGCGTAVQYKQCVALSCAADSECAVGWSCQTSSSTGCTSGGTASAGGATSVGSGAAGAAAAVSGAAVPAAADSGTVRVSSDAGATTTGSCQMTTTQSCQPKAKNPCQLSDDCGPGYDCVDEQVCACSGSAAVGSGTTAAGGATRTSFAGSGAATAGSTATPVPVDAGTSCVCGASGTMRCQAQTIACMATADCPETWTCSAVASSATGSTNYCQPPSQAVVGYNSGAPRAADDAGIATVGIGGTTSAGSNSTSTGSAAIPTNENSSGGSATGPASSQSTTPASSSGSDQLVAQGGGCQVSRGANSNLAAVLLGLLTLTGIRRGRRESRLSSSG